VRPAGDVPVTVTLRTGIDDDHLTYLEAGRVAADLGVAAVALHGRTAEQRYGPPADWSTIARLVDAVDVPVLGNGDIWEAADALRMVAETGAAGVVVGRGSPRPPWRVPGHAPASPAATAPPGGGRIHTLPCR
jgi:tRNA-dihydrouridine synthase